MSSGIGDNQRKSPDSAHYWPGRIAAKLDHMNANDLHTVHRPDHPHPAPSRNGLHDYFVDVCRLGPAPTRAREGAVVVTTVRAMKAHSGRFAIAPGRPLPHGLLEESPGDVRAGLPNLRKHVEIVREFGVQPVVAINAFPQDHDSEHEVIRQLCAELGVRCAVTRHVAQGGEGAEDLTREVLAALEEPTRFAPLYDLDLPLVEKIETIATRVYGQGVRYVEIFDANKDQILDPDLIYPGQVFGLPRTN